MSPYATRTLSATILMVCCLVAVGAGQDFAGGTGQSDDPYQIASANHLMMLAQDANLYDKHFVLTADIDLEGQAFRRAVIARDLYDYDFMYDGTAFTGTFDGAGHQIVNLTIDIGPPAGGYDFLGLFGAMDEGAVVKDLTLTDVTIKGGTNSDCLGSLAGRAYGATIENCSVSGAVTSGLNAQWIGGLVGECRDTSFNGCKSTCTVVGDENAGSLGGLVGSLTDGMLTDCDVEATVHGGTQSTAIGGLVGLARRVTASGCGSVSTVSGGIASSGVGGMIGYGLELTLEDCISSQAVSGQSLANRLGGLVGFAETGTLEGCSSTASVAGSSESFEVGGLIGRASSVTITGSHSTGSVSGGINADYLGGLVGLFQGRSERMFAEAKIVDCFCDGDVTGSDNSDHVGGLAGLNNSQGKIYRSYATGNVYAEEEVGGLVGWNSGSLVDCYATGQVSSAIDADRLGGLAGRNAGTICGCYATGAVIGDFNSDHLGGLVGKNEHIIMDCYATGAVSGGVDAEDIGGFIGFNQDNSTRVLRCYSSGPVTAESTEASIGGFVGFHRNGRIEECFWDVDSSGMVDGIGVLGSSQDADDVTGLTAAQMQNVGSFSDWGFSEAANTGLNHQWLIAAGDLAPILWWQRPEAVPLPTFSGGSGTKEDPYLIANSTDLNSIGYNPRVLDKHYKLVADLDLSAAQSVKMIGNDLNPFTGTFDGDGHSIDDGIIGAFAEYEDFLGVFGCLGAGSEVKSLSLSVQIRAEGLDRKAVGALAGWASGARVIDCYVTGDIAGSDYTGGLVGFADHCEVVGSSFSGAVKGRRYTGGLMAYCDQGHISGCMTEGTVEGDRWCGGLVAFMNDASLTYSANTASVTSDWDDTGGLIGYCNVSEVTHSYSIGAISGNIHVGGAIGESGSSLFRYVYSMGSVAGDSFVGGFGGHIYGGQVFHCYSTGAVSAETSWVGGFAGALIRNVYTDATVVSCFWDTETSGQTRGVEGQGLTTAQMKNIDTYLTAGWDFVDETENGTDDIWFMPEADYPHLAWEVGD